MLTAPRTRIFARGRKCWAELGAVHGGSELSGQTIRSTGQLGWSLAKLCNVKNSRWKSRGGLHLFILTLKKGIASSFQTCRKGIQTKALHPSPLQSAALVQTIFLVELLSSPKRLMFLSDATLILVASVDWGLRFVDLIDDCSTKTSSNWQAKLLLIFHLSSYLLWSWFCSCPYPRKTPHIEWTDPCLGINFG